jgi:heme iron utilization protein
MAIGPVIPKRGDARAVVQGLLREQRFGVLATEHAGEPYASLVAFAATPNMKTILFATPRRTRKYGNLRSEPRVAMLIDNTSNRAADFHAAVAVTILGRASELKGANRKAMIGVYLKRHPRLRTFARSPATTLFAVTVDRYVLVDRFQHVVQLEVRSWP